MPATRIIPQDKKKLPRHATTRLLEYTRFEDKKRDDWAKRHHIPRIIIQDLKRRNLSTLEDIVNISTEDIVSWWKDISSLMCHALALMTGIMKYWEQKDGHSHMGCGVELMRSLA